jgi:hypothetical protein
MIQETTGMMMIITLPQGSTGFTGFIRRPIITLRSLQILTGTIITPFP